jgi:hypothetical protein
MILIFLLTYQSKSTNTCFLPKMKFISPRNLSVTGAKCAFSIISILIDADDNPQRSPLIIFPALLKALSLGAAEPIN